MCTCISIIHPKKKKKKAKFFVTIFAISVVDYQFYMNPSLFICYLQFVISKLWYERYDHRLFPKWSASCTKLNMFGFVDFYLFIYLFLDMLMFLLIPYQGSRIEFTFFFFFFFKYEHNGVY
jgi:hypothetical protein